MILHRLVLLTLIFTMSTLVPAHSVVLQDEVLHEPSRSGVVELGPPAPPLQEKLYIKGVGTNVNTTQQVSPQNETSIAADPGNPQNLVAGTNDYRNGDGDAGYAYSFDAGATWVADTLAGFDSALGKYDAQGDPAIAAYGDGIFYYAFIDFSRSTEENRLAVAKSTDGGVTWPQLSVIVDHEGPTESHDFEDKEYIAVDNTGGPFDGNVYVSWTRFPAVGSTQLMFTRSTDGGNSFSAPMQISDSTGGYQGSVPAVGPNGEIYVTWWRSNGRIEIDKSTDGGATWGTDILVANVDTIPSPLPGATFRVNSFPTIAVDTTAGPHHGNVYVAWADNTGVSSGPDIILSRSTDGGQTWSNPIRVSDDANQAYQWFPWMSIDGEGNIDAVYFDRRDEPNSTRYHTYYAQSTDGGLSFGPNKRVSEAISDAINDGFGGGFIGDYNGVVSTPNTAHPYWTDIRDTNGNAEGYTAAITPEQPLGSSVYLRSEVGQPWGVSTNETAMDRVFGQGNWDDLRYETVDVPSLLSPDTTFIYMEGSDSNADELQAFLNANIDSIETWVTNGGCLFLNAAPNEGAGMNFGFGVSLNYPDFGSEANAVDPAHPIFNGPFTPAGPSYTGSSFSHATVSGAAITSLLNNEGANSVLAEGGFGSGHVFFGGMTTDSFHQPQPNAANLRANIIDFAARQCSIPDGVCPTCQIEAGLVAGTAEAAPGATISVPIEALNAPSEVDSLGFEVHYDATKLAFSGCDFSGTFLENWTFKDCNSPQPGVVVVGGFTADAGILLGDSGPVVHLSFDVVACEEGQQCPVELMNFVDDIATWEGCAGCFMCVPCNGDVNGDGQVTPADAQIVFGCFLEPGSCTPTEVARGDINRDGQLTPEDAQCIFNKFLERPPEEQCDCFLAQ